MEGSGSSRWLTAAAATATAAALISGCRVERPQEPPPAESEVLRRQRLQELLARTEAEGSVDVRAASGAPEKGLNEVEPLARNHEDTRELVQELRSMKLMGLAKRALSIGIGHGTVEDAMETDDSKSVLIKLIVDLESKRGPAERMMVSLRAGGTACAEMLHGVLDDAMDVLEQLSVSSPRKGRKALLTIMERV
eukprot:COSAG02_NODE_15035_length_1210_cov_8.403240_1_plen_193_part_10